MLKPTCIILWWVPACICITLTSKGMQCALWKSGTNKNCREFSSIISSVQMRTTFFCYVSARKQDFLLRLKDMVNHNDWNILMCIRRSWLRGKWTTAITKIASIIRTHVTHSYDMFHIYLLLWSRKILWSASQVWHNDYNPVYFGHPD